MYLDFACFENFRNIEQFPFSFDKGVNVLYGDNAQGKTNVIEGIYLFANGKSFRKVKEKDLIKEDKNHAQVSIAYVDSVRENKMSVRMFREMQRELFKNGVKIPKLSDFIGNFKAVLFCPEHLAIVKSEPAERRNFIDHAISQWKKSYLASLMEYKKLLEQRNALMRNAEEQKSAFSTMAEIFAERMAVAGASITSVRLQYLTRLFIYVNEYLRDMTGGREEASFTYLSPIAKGNPDSLFDKEENYQKYLDLFTRNLEKEKILGSTLTGTHREDFEILLNGKPAKIFGSQGQQRSIALAMKLAEGELAKEETDEYPVFLLDDVLSELDNVRKQYVLSELGNKQVIITACDEKDFRNLGNICKIRVENGNYTYMS